MDDIEKLLAEVNAVEKGSGKGAVAKRSENLPAKSEKALNPVAEYLVVPGVVTGLVAVLAFFLPFLGVGETAVGAFIGSLITQIVMTIRK